MLDWLIIGGGLHGVHLAHTLVHGLGTPPDRLRILDPHPTLLANWTRLTANVGMQFMRSPAVHHLGLEPHALSKFARGRTAITPLLFKEPYQRPAYSLFQAHSQHIIAAYELDRLHIQAAARGFARRGQGWRVETEQGELTAARLLLAIGRSALHWPEWAAAGRTAGAAIQHIFTPGFELDDLPEGEKLVVVGGGITAAQVALRLAERRPGRVAILARHPIREEQFDSKPGWLGPRYQTGFRQTPDYEQRRRMIRAARLRGSMPPDTARQLRQAVAEERLHFVEAEVTAVLPLPDGRMELIGRAGERLKADQTILATGFDPVRPGGEWLTEAIAVNELPCAPCGYPIVDRLLCWQPGLYVSGPLAELEIGPIAPNISGARQAAYRFMGKV